MLFSEWEALCIRATCNVELMNSKASTEAPLCLIRQGVKFYLKKMLSVKNNFIKNLMMLCSNRSYMNFIIISYEDGVVSDYSYI